MPYFVKKAIPIQAIQQTKAFTVNTLEGQMSGKPGDYLVIGAKGEKYPVDKDIFEETYYEVTEDVYNEYHARKPEPKYRCHVCENTFTETRMKVGIMNEGQAKTESRYNLCLGCYRLRGEISDLETVFFQCVHCRNTLPHYVLEKIGDGWQCKEPMGPCHAND